MRMGGYSGILTAAGLLLASCAEQVKIPPPSTDIDEIAYHSHLRMLASDEFEGRKPGTPGEDKTVAYLIAQFKKLGLKPGNGESYVQSVPMQETVTQADATLSLGGGRKGALNLAYGKDMVIWSERGSPQVELRHSDLVFVGYGIVAPEYAWNDYADTDVHGKTVVVLVNDPGYAAKDAKVFKGGTETYYGRWAYKIEEAVRQGAAGVLLVHDGDAVGFGWNIVQNTWSGAHLSLAPPPLLPVPAGPAVPPAHPGTPVLVVPPAPPAASGAAVEGWIQKDAARAMFGAAGLDFTATAAAAARAGFKPVALGLKADVTLHNSVRQITSSNVIAQLPGGSHHGEYVVFTAHWDHLGRNPALTGHNIFNGAVDNASGAAGLLTLAQSFVRTKPVADRTMVFLALTGGEAGLLGSEYYVENPIFPIRVTAAVVNLDTLRYGGPSRDVTILGAGNSDLEDYARGAALLQGREVTPDPMPELGLYYWSDNFNFAKAGIPALYAKRGFDDSARGPVWGRAQYDDYMAHRFRQPSDQYSSDWDVRGAVEDLTLYYAVGNRVAHNRRFPRWYSGSEFRVSREHKPLP